MPAAASQLGLHWQLQQQGGPDRAELSLASGSRLSLQLRGLMGELPKLMINAYARVASSSSSATANPPAHALCAAAPVRPCCNTSSRALGAGAWNYLRIRIPEFELFFRAGPHPAGLFMGNSTHHPPPKQQHRGFEPLGYARPPGPQSLRRRHLPENAGAHPATGSDGPGGGFGRYTHDSCGPDSASRAGPRMPPNTGRLHGGLAGTRATPAFHGTVRDSTHRINTTFTLS